MKPSATKALADAEQQLHNAKQKTLTAQREAERAEQRVRLARIRSLGFSSASLNKRCRCGKPGNHHFDSLGYQQTLENSSCERGCCDVTSCTMFHPEKKP